MATVIVNGRCIDGRVSAIILWLLERADRLNNQQRVKLEFDCAGDRIVPRCAVFEDMMVLVVKSDRNVKYDRVDHQKVGPRGQL